MSRYSSRSGFSLLEVMIATSVLAASAMVLLSLISLGTKFGSKAETRIAALVQAQSILDESVMRMQSGESIESYTGSSSGSQPRSYRVTVEPFQWSDPTSMSPSGSDPIGGQQPGLGMNSFSSGMEAQGPPLGPMASGASSGVPAGPQPSELVSVKVELYDSEIAAAGLPSGGRSSGLSGASSNSDKPLIELVRIVRRSPATSSDGAMSNPSNRQIGR